MRWSVVPTETPYRWSAAAPFCTCSVGPSHAFWKKKREDKKWSVVSHIYTQTLRCAAWLTWAHANKLPKLCLGSQRWSIRLNSWNHKARMYRALTGRLCCVKDKPAEGHTWQGSPMWQHWQEIETSTITAHISDSLLLRPANCSNQWIGWWGKGSKCGELLHPNSRRWRTASLFISWSNSNLWYKKMCVHYLLPGTLNLSSKTEKYPSL